ncbi:dipeptide/oligopeptide/nickel ABC transporter permease/ATP-binding protein [Ferrimonas balearica]|nr:dipeptide/oligopeptide/nickel ABC transporter permease/ATP-binding protein [Ferrimonas balearica]
MNRPPFRARLAGLRVPPPLRAPTAMVVLLLLAIFLGPSLLPHDPNAMAISERLSPPSWAHPLGQDEFGRDRLVRLLEGGKVSLTVALTATGAAAVIGVFLGLVGAFNGGISGYLSNRLADVVLCFPPVLLALLVVTLLGPGADTLIYVLSVLYFPPFARIAFTETSRIAGLDYVVASRAIGTANSRIMARTILPNIAGPLFVQLSLTAAAAVIIESGMSFLGLGVVPPDPSWGQMINAARATMTSEPLGLMVPCAALVITIFTINFFCDRLRDHLDPRALATRVPLLPGLGGSTRAAPPREDEVVRVSDLTIDVPLADREPIDLLRQVSFQIRQNSCTALVGESGSGKSLSALSLMGLLPDALHRRDGALELRRRSGEVIDVADQDEDSLQALRGNDVAMVFQEPMSALNPVMRVGDQIIEAIQAHRDMPRAEARALAIDGLRRVGITDPEQRVDAFPHEISGGMKQRVMIAMALVLSPKLLIADEPTTALDVTVQAEIIHLLRDIRAQSEDGLSILFVSHNLGVVSELADRIVVMYAGEVVEAGLTDEVLSRPSHPYTKALLNSTPSLHENLHSARGDVLDAIPGAPPLAAERPAGCAFHPRCALATEACRAAHPALRALDPATGGATPETDREVRCIRAEELAA